MLCMVIVVSELLPYVQLLSQVLICRNEAEKCLIETSINSLRISLKVNANPVCALSNDSKNDGKQKFYYLMSNLAYTRKQG